MGKRLFDVIVSAAGLVIVAPLLLALAVAVWWSVGRPVLFRQRRVAINGREFELRKFRSMREIYTPSGVALPDEERVTRTGRFLRRSRLDELPELWMILRGDMSFVGPRPLPRTVLEAYNVLDRRSRTRPGLTGLAQVSGNTTLSLEEKIALDLYYNDKRTFFMDLTILAGTLKTVIVGERRNPRRIAEALAHAQHFDWCRR